MSAKQRLPIRRIILRDGTAYSIRPSFLMPYLTARADEVEAPLFLRKFGVPFWALARVFGRDPMFYYRLECALGRASIVGTTVKVDLPEHLAADEHHQTRDGEKIYIATTVGGGCCLGAEPAEAAGTDELTAAYGVFREEARDRRRGLCPGDGQHRWLEGDAGGLEGAVPQGGAAVVLLARLAEDPRSGQASGRAVPRDRPPGLGGLSGAEPPELRPATPQPAAVGRETSVGSRAGDRLGPVRQAATVVDRLRPPGGPSDQQHGGPGAASDGRVLRGRAAPARHGGGEPPALPGLGVALELRAVEPGDDPSEPRLA